jgi:hypothetical protein
MLRYDRCLNRNGGIGFAEDSMKTRRLRTFGGDSKTFAMMRLSAQAVQTLGKVRGAKVHWTADVELFDAAMEATIGTLRAFCPAGVSPTNVRMPVLALFLLAMP